MSRKTKETAYAIGHAMFDNGYNVETADHMAECIGDHLYPEDESWAFKFRELIMEAWCGIPYDEPVPEGYEHV